MPDAIEDLIDLEAAAMRCGYADGSFVRRAAASGDLQTTWVTVLGQKRRATKIEWVTDWQNRVHQGRYHRGIRRGSPKPRKGRVLGRPPT